MLLSNFYIKNLKKNKKSKKNLNSKIRKYIKSAYVLCFLLGTGWGQTSACGQQPSFAGNVLIIYNDPPPRFDEGVDIQYSERAMRTFRAALASDRSHVASFPTNIGWTNVFDADCAIPQLQNVGSVNTLLVGNTQRGFENALISKFGNSGTDDIDGQPFDRAGFNEFLSQDNPLAYWSQVYDLRFNDAGWPHNNEDMSSITNRDIELFGNYLRSGGGLYVQTVRAMAGNDPCFRNRNAGVQNLIRAVTRDIGYDNIHNRGSVGGHVGSFEFHDWQNFNCSPNDLAQMQQQSPMHWRNPGVFPVNQLTHGRALMTRAGADRNQALLVGWDTEGMAPSIGNGMLVVGYSIIAWVPQHSSSGTNRVSCATFGIIQNLFTLMNQPMFEINKEFFEYQSSPAVPLTEIMNGRRGTCRITISNMATYAVHDLVIADPLPPCLVFVQGSGRPTQPTLSTDAQGRTVLTWSNITLPAKRGETYVEFDFEVNLQGNCD